MKNTKQKMKNETKLKEQSDSSVVISRRFVSKKVNTK